MWQQWVPNAHGITHNAINQLEGIPKLIHPGRDPTLTSEERIAEYAASLRKIGRSSEVFAEASPRLMIYRAIHRVGQLLGDFAWRVHRKVEAAASYVRTLA
jgi:hypothetical protein